MLVGFSPFYFWIVCTPFGPLAFLGAAMANILSIFFFPSAMEFLY